MEQAFRLFEGGHPGQVSPSQVREICASLGVPLPHSLDGPEERLVDLASYMTAMRKALWKRADQGESVEQTFEMFSEGGPFIELRHLKKIAHELGDQTLAEQDLLEMINHASGNSGKVSREAFLQLMSS